MSLNQLIRKLPTKFCKQNISDSLNERLILTNDYILPIKALDVLLVYDVIQSEPRGHAEKKNLTTCCNQNMPALPLSDDL